MKKIAAILFLASCRAQDHQEALDPVQAFLREAKAGTTTVASFRSTCDDVVDDGTVKNWSDEMKAAVKDHGRDVRCEIVSKSEGEARVKLTFPSGASGSVIVRERLTGWWITGMSLDLAAAAPPRSKPFACGGEEESG